MTVKRFVPGILLVGALTTAYASVPLGLWSFGAPGPGLFPLVASSIILVGVLCELVSRPIPQDNADTTDWVRFLQYCVAIIGFVVGVHFLGAGPAIFLFITLVLGRIEQVGWRRSATIAAAAAITSWSVFHSLLAVPLPQGVWS